MTSPFSPTPRNGANIRVDMTFKTQMFIIGSIGAAFAAFGGVQWGWSALGNMECADNGLKTAAPAIQCQKAQQTQYEGRNILVSGSLAVTGAAIGHTVANRAIRRATRGNFR